MMMTAINHHKPVFLIGFMGSGKTTWGRKLANRLDWPFLDLDDQLESDTGVSIANYFSQHGEAAFRQLEHDTLKRIDAGTPAIISTGGGTPCFHNNMEWMNTIGITIYLQLPPKALWTRLMQTDIATRPALHGLTGPELLTYITEKLGEREAHYRQATHVVDQLSLRIETLISLIN